MSEFDLKAREWDKNPMNIERSEAIAEAILSAIPLHSEMKAMEYGAGTGLLSFLLKDKLAKITLMDSSNEMILVTEEKIKSTGVQNLTSLFFDLEKENLTDRFHFIFNQMVLHHVNDVNALFEKFYNLLLPSGYLAIADLYPEDGSFHGSEFNGYRGFDPEQLSILLKRMGFSMVKYNLCYRMKKPTSSGEIREYPLFLLIATK